MFTIKQLRYFVAVADAGVLAHAAQNLNVAQSALSHHIAQLEGMLNVELFERQARGVTLTPAGHRLVAHAKAILSMNTAALEDVREFVDDPSGKIGIGMAHTVVDVLALPLMQRIRAELPRVTLGITEDLSGTLLHRLLEGELDIGLVFNAPEDSRFEVTPLFSEDLYIIGTTALIGDSDEPLSFADMALQPILAPYPSGSLRAVLDDHALRKQVKAGALLEVDSLAALRLALSHGLGYTILGKSSVYEEISSGRVHARRITNPDVRRSLDLVSLSSRPRTRAFLDARSIIMKVAEEAVASGKWEILPIATAP